MIAELKKLLSKVSADYADIRYETKRETTVSFNGETLGGVSTSAGDGYVLRVLKGGGFATASFTCAGDAQKAIKSALANAKLLSNKGGQKVKLAKTRAIKDEYFPPLDEDPAKVSLEEKIALTRKYNAIALENPKIITTVINYAETDRDRYFASSEGHAIRERLVTASISGSLTAKEGALLQTVRVSAGGSNGFKTLRNRDDVFASKAGIAAELLKAEPARGGVYDIVLDPELAGVFVHEAFGHFSEADLIEDSPTMRAKMELGARLGSGILNIKDDPTLAAQLGHYKYDDEGVAARPVQLMKDGVLAGRLHSRRTATAFGEPLTGHCVAEDYRYAPIIRMGTIMIEPGRGGDIGGLLAKTGNGLYILGAKGGETAGESFTFGAQYAYEIKNGKRGRMLRDINISGNLYATLGSIADVGNDLRLCEGGGACGKGQLNIRSCMGSPHILIRKMVVGGAVAVPAGGAVAVPAGGAV